MLPACGARPGPNTGVAAVAWLAWGAAFRRVMPLALAWLCAVAATAPAFAQPAGPTQAENLARLTRWFAGEWNNNEQVWQQKIAAADAKVLVKEDPSEHVHHIFAPVPAPLVGAQVFYVQQAAADKLAKPYRQRLYRFTADEAEAAVKLEIFRFKDEGKYLDAQRRPESFSGLGLEQLQPTPGCEVWWRFDAARQAFAGTMKPGACSFVSPRSGQRVFISDTLELTEHNISINDQARDEAGNYVFGSKSNTPNKARKVRYFDGWVWFKLAGPQASADDKKTRFMSKIRLHSEGDRVPITLEDGSPSPYVLELAQLTYQNTRQPILKFALLDASTGKSLTYIWANTDATRIGMNLNWFQSGLSQRPENTHFLH